MKYKAALYPLLFSIVLFIVFYITWFSHDRSTTLAFGAIAGAFCLLRSADYLLEFFKIITKKK